MNTQIRHDSKNRFLKLSLKKNTQKIKNKMNIQNNSSEVIVLDESFDVLKLQMTESTKQVPKIFSPIVINDSCEQFSDPELPHITLSSGFCTPASRKSNQNGNISFNKSSIDNSITEAYNSRPSIGGVWSPAQNIICATPRNKSIPSTPKDVANESQEECTMKKIEQSQKKVLDDLYGDVWKSLPNLFKSKPRKLDNCNLVSKKLFNDDFDDDEKENFRELHKENKTLYLTGSDAKRKVLFHNNNEEKRSKKKLYTEKIPNTPEPKSNKKGDAKSTTKKKLKGKTITEMVDNLDGFRRGINDFNPINVSVKNDVGRLSFMASLADDVPTWRCNIEALIYKDDFKNKKDELARKLFLQFNKEVFDGGLDNDMPILWDTKLRSTAGLTTNRLLKMSNGNKTRSSSIKLSTKVVDGPQRLRDTLIHEMCHSATWIIDHVLKAAHGPLWRKWATKAISTLPELGDISRCHNMDIHYKYTYKCTKCGYSVQRHSKSIDVSKKCCGYCRGTFQLILNKKTKDGQVVSTPARSGEMNAFAMYVKENYDDVKHGKTHAEIMKVLGQQFSAKKKNKES